MASRWAFGLMLIALAGGATPALADKRDECLQEQDWELRVEGCTAIILLGMFEGADRAAVLTNRGTAFANLGALERALEDSTRRSASRPRSP